MAVGLQASSGFLRARLGLRGAAWLPVALSVLTLLASSPASFAACPDGGPAVGEWRFTTRLLPPNSKGAKGATVVNAYYSLSVTQAPDCTLAAKLVKTGVGKQRFDAASQQTVTTTLRPLAEDATVPALAPAWALSGELRSDSGGTEEAGFFLFFDGKSVDGLWRLFGQNSSEAGTPAGLLGKRGRGANVAFASTKGLSARTRCLVEECRFGSGDEVLCRDGYAECASVAGGAPARRASRDWFGSPFSVAAGGPPVRFEGRDAQVPCPNAEGVVDGGTCYAYVYLLLEADLVPALPGLEALVKFRPDAPYYGSIDYGSTLLVLGTVKGRTTTLASQQFTAFSDQGMLGQLTVDGGTIAVKGGYVAPSDYGEPCHAHDSTYGVSATADGYELKRLSQTISEEATECE
jgi:hypothetical protein